MATGWPATDPVLIDVFLLRSDWQRAALVVALVVVPGAIEQFEALHRAGPPRPDGAEGGPIQRSSRGRHVRPPRSC